MKNLISFFLILCLVPIGCRKDPIDKTDFPYENNNIRMEVVSVTFPKPAGRFTDMQFIDEKTGFIISYDGRIYKTNDKGNSWTLKFMNPTPHQPFFKVLFIDKNIGYVAGGANLSWGGGKCPGGVVLKTVDGGETWTSIYEVSGQIEFVEIAKNNIGDLFLIQSGFSGPGKSLTKILKSVDGGLNWLTTASLTENVKKITFSNTRGFCCGGNSNDYTTIIRSDDNGNSWNNKTDILGYSVRDIAFANDVGYCITANSLVYQTTNNGEYWIQIFPSLKYSSWLLNPLTGNSCLIWGSGQYVESENRNESGGGLRQTRNRGIDWIDHEIKDLGGVAFSSFFSPTEGYLMTDKLIKVTVK